MRRIGVRTENVRLSFQILKELKKRKCGFVMLSNTDSWDEILITSPEEAAGGDGETLGGGMVIFVFFPPTLFLLVFWVF